MLHHLILEDQSSLLLVPDILKQLTIKDAVYWSAKAWDEITVDNLKKDGINFFPPPLQVTLVQTLTALLLPIAMTLVVWTMTLVMTLVMLKPTM